MQQFNGRSGPMSALRHKARTRIALAMVGVAASTAIANAGEFLSPEKLKDELGGKTIKGYYTHNKVNFVEIYRDDGRITYKDDLKADGGSWSVRGRAFCTFYDTINGGCWYVVKRSVNCFEFYAAPNSGAPVAHEDLMAMRPQALAARDSDKVTCEAWFGT